MVAPFPPGRTTFFLFARAGGQEAAGGAGLLVHPQDFDGIDTPDYCRERATIKIEGRRNLRHILKECFGTRPQTHLQAGPVRWRNPPLAA
jgi:hypothetical protein